MSEILRLPITNLGFEMLIGTAGTQPTITDKVGDIKTAPPIVYIVNKQKYNPVNGDGFAKQVPLDAEGQEVDFEVYMNGPGFNKVYDAFINRTPVSLAHLYPEVDSTVKNYWYNGIITKAHKSAGTDPEVQYFTFGFIPSGAPQEWVEPVEG